MSGYDDGKAVKERYASELADKIIKADRCGEIITMPEEPYNYDEMYFDLLHVLTQMDQDEFVELSEEYGIEVFMISDNCSAEFKELVKKVHQDAKEYDELFFILEEKEYSVYVEDNLSGFDYRFEFTDAAVMTPEWLNERIVITPSAEKTGFVSREWLADYISNNVPKEVYQTLNRLVFIADDEEDFGWFCSYTDESMDRDFGELLERHDLPGEDLIGISWATDCCCIVNVGAIIRGTDEMIQEGSLYDYERADCINHSIKTTIVHEFRHLQQNNPYVSEEIRKSFKSDPEADAEDFARDVVDGLYIRPR